MKAHIEIEKSGNIHLYLVEVPKDISERKEIIGKFSFCGNIEKDIRENNEDKIHIEFWGNSFLILDNIITVKQICNKINAEIEYYIV